MTAPVTARRIQIAKDFGLVNVDEAAIACRRAGLPFFAACALLEKESGGRNVYGHDRDGALSGFPGQVNAANYAVFEWMLSNGWDSNGVGPTQITWPGFFTAMAEEGLRPWVVADNMFFGFRLLARHYAANKKSWRAAGRAYNGADSYGVDLERKVKQWKERLHI